MSGLKDVKLGRPCYLQIELSSGNLENLGLGQGKRIWQTQQRGKSDAMEQKIGRKQGRPRLDL